MKGDIFMFKRFFNMISDKFKNIRKNIRKSKIYKFAKKAIKFTGSACIVITAFNAGNIHEAVSHMNDAPTTIGDTIRWGIVLCSDWIKNVKAKNFTWDVKQIFMPFVGAVIYCGAKIIKRIYRIMKWIKSHKIVNTAVKATKPAPTMTVADPFGTM